MLDNSFPAFLFSFSLVVVFFNSFLNWRISRAHLFRFSGQDQSTVAQRAETTVAEFPDELRVSLFPDRFPHYACTAA